MDPIQRVITRAQRRWWINATLAWFSWLALAAVGLAVVLLLIDDLLSIAITPWAYLALAVIVCLAAPLIAYLRRPTAADIAELIDHRLGLKDRLSTALFLRQHPADDVFTNQVITDAARAADRLSLRDAFACRLGRAWAYLPVAAIALLLLALLVPGDLDLLGLNQARAHNQQAAQQAAAAKKRLIQARARLNELTHRKDQPKPADANRIMYQLASLSNQNLNTPQAREQAATKISNLSNQLDQLKQQKHRQFQSLANAMTQLDPGTQGPADKLAAALRRGDFKAAQQAIQQMKQQIKQGNYSAQQKKQLQRQLNHMAKQLKQMAKQAKRQQQQMQQQTQKTLQQAGLSQKQIQQLQKQGFSRQAVQKAVQQALGKRGMSQQQAQQQAQQIARQIQQQQQQAQANGQNSSTLRGLGQAFGQMGSLTQNQQQQSGKSSKQGQKQGKGKGNGQGQSRFQQGAWSAQQQMKQIARMQQQIQRMGLAQAQMQRALQQMAGGGKGKKNHRGPGVGGGHGASRGGIKAGTGRGGNPIGQPQQPMNVPSQAEADLEHGKGRVIASWMSDGKPIAGTPKVNFNKTITAAQNQAAQAVTQDRVPRQYHRAIHEYFNQLPQSANQAQQAPTAPH